MRVGLLKMKRRPVWPELAEPRQQPRQQRQLSPAWPPVLALYVTIMTLHHYNPVRASIVLYVPDKVPIPNPNQSRTAENPFFICLLDVMQKQHC